MKSKTKIWLGVGVFALTGAGAVAGKSAPAISLPREEQAGPLLDGAFDICSASPRVLLAQLQGASDGGEAGEAGLPADMPPDSLVAVSVALMRGHLSVGDELVRAGLWDAALPHFLHPTEELYAGIADKLVSFRASPFDDALNALAEVVKKRSKGEYDVAMRRVREALDATEAGVREQQQNWPSFVIDTVMTTLKTAGDEYGNAIANGRIAKPVEYQDARGFVFTAERMLEGVSEQLSKKNPAALKRLRDNFKALKKAWPGPMPPKSPAKTPSAVLGDIARIQLAASGLM